MKKIIITIILCLLAICATAQKDSLRESKVKVFAGFMLNPEGSISLNRPDNLKTEISLYFILPIEKGNWKFTPFYCHTSKLAGTFIEYAFENASFYTMLAKSTDKIEEFLSFGSELPILKEQAYLFMEFGSQITKWEPYTCFGISVPITLKLKYKK